MRSDASSLNHHVALGLGGNSSKTREAFKTVVRALSTHHRIEQVAVSRLYGTVAIGNADSRFLNACVLIKTSLGLEELLVLAKQLEQEAGRARGQAWGNRPLDVDVLLSDRVVMRQPQLVVPHLWMHVRRFVLDPLCDLWPDQMHPMLMRSVASLREHWRRRPLRLSVDREIAAAASMVKDAFGDDVQLEQDAAAADFVLLSRRADRTAWPPQINVRDWPMKPDAAVLAAVRGIIDAPEVVEDLGWAE